MKKLLLIMFLIFPVSQAISAEGLYINPSLLFTYGSNSDESKSSLLGTGVGLTGGLRFKNLSMEIGVKRFKITSDQIGNEDFDTIVFDSIFQGGVRLFLDNIFSLKFGVSNHFIEMDIYEGNTHLKGKEDDGEFIGLYGGMGIFHPMSDGIDFYYESTLYPVPEVDFYFVDLEVGFRFYL